MRQLRHSATLEHFTVMCRRKKKYKAVLWTYTINARFEIPTMVLLEILFFWYVILCHWVSTDTIIAQEVICTIKCLNLPLMLQYILSLLTFVSNNREQYFANSEIHNINTTHTPNLHLPRARLNIYQKGVHYSGIKIFNSLPQDMKTYIDNPQTFKKAVKKFLYTNSFYLLNEHYDNNKF